MTKIIYNKLCCFTCNNPLEEEGVIIQEKTQLSGRIRAFCPVCSKHFAKGEVYNIVMEWTKC